MIPPISEFEETQLSRLRSMAGQLMAKLAMPLRALSEHRRDEVEERLARLGEAQGELYHHENIRVAIADFQNTSMCLLDDLVHPPPLEDLKKQRGTLRSQYKRLLQLIDARLVTPRHSEPSPKESAPVRPRPGPKPKTESHKRLAEIVQQYGDTWKQNLTEICQQADKQKLFIPKTWSAKTWKGGLKKHPDKVVKVIESRLRYIGSLPSTND